MAGMILRKTGAVLLTILKGLLYAALMILKLDRLQLTGQIF